MGRIGRRNMLKKVRENMRKTRMVKMMSGLILDSKEEQY